MIRVGLIDTTIQGFHGSMVRYRDQLATALSETGSIVVSIHRLGMQSERFSATPPRFRMWRHHLHVWRAARRIDVSDLDVLHVLDGSFGYVVQANLEKPTVCTVHDIIPRLQLAGDFPSAPKIGRGAAWLINRSLRGISKATVAVSDSQSTADDLARFAIEPRQGTQVVPLAVEPGLFRLDAASKQDVPSRFLFHLGNNGFYKNRLGAIEILERIRPSLDVSLVLAGPPLDDALRTRVESSKCRDRISIITNPDQEKLCELYKNATAFVFPSLYEGFGWPPLEAMSVGCPVVTSNAGSLPEVVGDAGAVLNVGDYQAMARACEKLVECESLRQEMTTKGFQQAESFSLDQLGRRMKSIYQELSVDSHG